SSTPIFPLSQCSNLSGWSRTGIRSWTSATNSFGSQIIIAHDLIRSPDTQRSLSRLGDCAQPLKTNMLLPLQGLVGFAIRTNIWANPVFCRSLEHRWLGRD